MYRNNKGSALLVSVAFAGVIGLGAVYAFTSYVSAYNYGNQAENTIIAEYDNMKNILSTYSNTITEIAQVPEAQKNDFKEIVEAEMSGRYGNGGGQVMQWIQERQLSLNTDLYSNIQIAMTAGRNKFETAQTQFIDTKRVYETELGYLVRGFWLHVAGKPKINLADYKIIQSGYANDAFTTGIENGVKIN